MWRMYYMNIETGKEIHIDVRNNDEILPALNANPQYKANPDNWEYFDQEEI